MRHFVILLNFIPCAFGALFTAATRDSLTLKNTSGNIDYSLNSLTSANVDDTLTTSENSLNRPQSRFAMLPDILIIEIAHYLDNPYYLLPFLCRSIWMNLKNNCCPQRILQSRTKYKKFDEIETSVELHRLLKLHPNMLNRYFMKFVTSNHAVKVLNKVILEYAFPKCIDENTSNIPFLTEFVNTSMYELIVAEKYDSIEYLIKLALLNSPDTIWSQVFHYEDGKNMENLFRILYETKKPLLKILIKRGVMRAPIFSVLLTTQMTLEEFWDFVNEAEIEDQEIRELVLEPAFHIIARRNEYFNSLIAEDKEFICARNKQIIQDHSLYSIDWKYIEYGLIEDVLSSRSEEFDLKALIDNYSNSMDSGWVTKDDIKSNVYDMISNIANVAVHESRFDLISNIKNVKIPRKKGKLYITTLSPNEIERASNGILKFVVEHSYTEQTNFTVGMEIIRRKHSDLRTLHDLKLFSNFTEKFVALAKFYPIETFRKQLPLVPKDKDEYNSIIYRIIKHVDNPAPFVHEIIMAVSISNRLVNTNIHYSMKQEALKMLSGYSSPTADNLNLMYPKYIANLLEPRNAQIIKDLSIYPAFKITSPEFIEAVTKTLEFRKRFTSPEAKEFRSHFEIDFNSFFKYMRRCNFPKISVQGSYLAHEIVDFFKLFGLEFGGFEINPEELQYFDNSYSVSRLKTLRLGALDNILVAATLEHYENYRKRFNYNSIPMMQYFGVFQLWRERNLANFEDFAPTEICELFP